MSVKQIIPGLFSVRTLIPTGSVNAFILVTPKGLTLIDTGYPDQGRRLLGAVAQLGHTPRDVNQILVTHAHVDHAGNLAALKAATGASVTMHRLDATLVRTGSALRPETTGTPGLPNQIAFAVGNQLLPRQIAPADIDDLLEDGETSPAAGGLRAIHVPGHSQGQLAFLWLPHGVLFAADAAVNLFGKLRYGPVTENFEQAQSSVRKLTLLDFDVACFGHGDAITTHADMQFPALGLIGRLSKQFPGVLNVGQ